MNIFWLRRDLRLADNTALNAALNSGEKVQPIFIFDTKIINELDEDDARISFIYNQLVKIHFELLTYGSSLKVFFGNPEMIWNEITQKVTVNAVYVNRDYEPYGINRDASIKKELNKKNIPFFSFKDQVIFEKDEVIKKDGTPYTVFTPYKNKWLERFNSTNIESSKILNVEHFQKSNYVFPSLEDMGFVESNIKVPEFNLSTVPDYEATRNFPHLDKTSKIGPHLRFGTVSIRTIVNKVKSKSDTYLSELIWREFFMQILWHFPNVVHNNFRAKYNGIEWRNNQEEFQKWCKGKTGFPIVDAGMRELNETGFMHNRVRMITASFLCKHLLIDWRWGEAYFAKKLLDYELSSNNGNWQWSAGTGCDAAPYFRVFNPYEQTKKFDPSYTYIKKWVKDINEITYPHPMVDHAEARKRAIATYKEGLLNLAY
ncbi:MAG: deoxyribodipyrimidine photolyase [Crocinitomicaceae bacterium]|nr:deoxyribodipyrimidine photolyase [Crocinitomicaceae bacterium]|tara:strand:- start:178 stop:1464 length:1287 start_codon:yes stop_codon:yes gene_type:complete